MNRNLYRLVFVETKQINILYIDDETDLLDLVKLYLGKFGNFFVDTCNSVKEASIQLTRGNYDCILSDYEMPETDGIMFLKEVREKHSSDIPFIIFTGRGREDVVIEALNNGADYYVQKGGDPAAQFTELSHKITRAVKRRWADEELRASNEQMAALIQQLRASEETIVEHMRLIKEEKLKLQKSENQFNAFMDNLPGVAFIKNTTGKYHFINKFCRECFGTPKGWSPGREIIDKPKIPNVADELSEIDLRAFDEGKFSYDGIFADKAGKIKNFHNELFRIQDEEEDLIGGIAVDITDQIMIEDELRASNEQMTALIEEIRATEETIIEQMNLLGIEKEKLAESEEKYRKLFENAPIPIYIIQNRRIKFGNLKALEIVNATDKEIFGTPFLEYIHPDQREMIIKYHNMRLSGNSDAPAEYLLKVITKDGKTRIVRFSTLVINWEGQPATLNFLLDISEEFRTKEELELANNKIRVMNEITVHDLKNQITTMKLSADLLERAGEDIRLSASSLSKIREGISSIEEQADFMNSYMKMGIEAPEWRDAESVVKKAADSFSKQNIQFEIDLPGYEILSDGSIYKIYYNLFDNSMRHAKVSTITVNSRINHGGDLNITIEDDGRGIREDQKTEIFRRGVGEGTGLGLFLVREILEMNGFSIRETGTEGEGAQFEISVPSGHFRIKHA